MPGETPVNKIPYAVDSDVPNYPAQGKALADLLDTLKWGSRNLKPTCGVKAASENLTLTASYQDVPGAVLEITPAVPSILRVTAVFDLETATGSSKLGRADGTLKLDAEAELTRVAKLQMESGEGEAARRNRATVVQVYSIALTAAAHTIKMRAKTYAADGVGKCLAANTAFVYELVAS